jgi:hypothetical protein
MRSATISTEIFSKHGNFLAAAQRPKSVHGYHASHHNHTTTTPQPHHKNTTRKHRFSQKPPSKKATKQTKIRLSAPTKKDF